MYSKNDSVAEEVRFAEKDHQNKASKPHRIREIKALGTENRKVYRMSDGSEQAVFCPGSDLVFNPKTAAFEKADNTLIETKDHRYFKNKNGKFLARFSNERENNELFFIEKDGHSIGVSVRKPRTQEKGGFLPHLKMRYTNAQHEQSNQMLTFDDVLPDTDMEYTVNRDGIKENIIIRKQRSNHRYRFWLDCTNLSVSFDTKTKAVHFLDPQTQERIFEIPAPFMVDALGARSEDVFYDLKRVSGKRIAFTVQADSNWINAPERVLPITIDPQINVSSGSFLKTITKQGNTLHTGTAEEHKVGKAKNTYGNVNDYSLKIQMPTWDELSLPPHAHIESAALTFTQESFQINNADSVLKLFAVADTPSSGSSSGSDDDDDELVSPCHRSTSGYALTQEADSNTDLFDAPTLENPKLLLDYRAVSPQSENSLTAYTFDITQFMDRTVGNSYDFSQLVLEMVPMVGEAENYIKLYGTGKSPDDGYDYRPKLTVTYTCDLDTSAQQRSHTQDLGRFGQSHVDLLYGTLTLSAPDFEWNGNRMPVSISHLYHSKLNSYRYRKNDNLQLDVPRYDMHLGYGWRLNVMESMSIATPPATNRVSGTAYLYTDAFGKQTYFIDNGNGEYKDAEDKGMTYHANTKTMTHEDYTYQFDASGCLISLADKNNNKAKFNYQNDRITTITDGADRLFSFSYNPNGTLASITAPDDSSISYTYQGDYLSSITYPDGKKAEISYENKLPANIYLKDANNTTVHQAKYTYDSSNRVCKVVETGFGEKGGGRSLTYEYHYSPADRRTLVSLISNGQVLNKIVYDFDNKGAVKNVYHHNSSPTHAEQYRATNLLKDHDFSSKGAWLAEGNNADWGTTVSIVAPANSVYGSKCLQITNACGDAYDCGVKQESVLLEPGDYTFSAYVKCISSTATARICVEFSNNTTLESESISASDAYTRLIVPFNLPSAQRVKCRILTQGYGSVLVHAPQLENNVCANPYSMVVNGNFSNGTSNWHLSSNASLAQIKEDEASSSLLLMASKDSAHVAKQTVAVKTPASTREIFTLSGWAKRYENGNQKTNTKVNFGLGVKFFYGNEVYVPPVAYKAFSPYTNDWQFTSLTFAKPAFTPVDYIGIYCICQGLEGGAYFDDIALVRETLETDLTVDDFMGEEEENEEQTETTESFEELEDAYGNPVTLTAFDEEHTDDGAMYRSFGYSHSGNNLARFTDTRGKSTVFNVNPVSSRVSSITDRCGNTTAYTYNSAGATERMSLQNPEWQDPAQQETAPQLSYTYDDCGNLLSVSRGDNLTYNFAYAPFHQLQEVKLTGKSDRLYQYDCTQDYKLQVTGFANGYAKHVTCNSLGQGVKEVWYDDNYTVIAEYLYTYDRSGNTTRVIDKLNKKEYNYIYQDGSLVRFTERDITTGMILAEHRYRNGKDTLNKDLCLANGTQLSCKYTDTKEQQTAALSFEDDTRLNIVATLDSHGRKTAETVKLDSKQILHRDFTYLAGKATAEHVENDKCPCAPTTPLVGSIRISDERTLSYTYDNEQRITRVEDSFNDVTSKTSYTYDAQGQLLTEKKDGVYLNCITYDGYGNILIKNGKAYTYDTVWKDQLKTVGNESIFYDAQGNPTSYLGHALTWTQGNRLKTYDNTSYAYNHQGLRTKKTVNGVAHTYLWEGTRLISEAYNGNTMVTLYGSDGSVCGILYNDIRYYFNKNLQGDVISILNMAGNTVAQYTYDAWGKILSITDAQGTPIEDDDDTNIALINPYRYRGYYFDSESNFYYLQTRYYDPETGRFISPGDVSSLNPSKINGLNLYSYANNNPISIAYSSSNVYGSASCVMVNCVGAFGISSSLNSTTSSKKESNLSRILSSLETGAGIHGLYTSISGLVNHTLYFAKNTSVFCDDMTMIGASMKEGVLAFNQFSWKLGKADIFGVVLGVGLDIYDSTQRGVSTGGVVLGATLTAAKGVGLIYLNKGILYGATAFGTAICPGPGTAVGFVVGGIVCVFVDIFASNWLDELIDKIAK